MFFNSYPFLFLFLPLVTLVFHLLSRVSSRCSTGWIILASLFFYGCFQPWMVGVLLGEALVNHALARCAASHTASRGRRVSCTALAVTFDLLVLGYFKYADFFLANMGSLLGEQWSLHRLIFPVGISFYTFQLVAYVVDAYRGKVERFDLLDYLAFVTFFPKLLSGPIVLDRELTGQFSRASGVDWDLFNRGVVLFVVGLFKKVVIADAFAPMVHNGFDTGEPLAFVAAWVASLGYTVQLYFDFSGYMDMALGCALLLGIKLPPNFDSPYKSLSIQDFWRRWHITLGRFLRDYIYIPLGGNRGGTLATCRNLFVTFLLGGIWHGAGWTFVVWGGLHGAGAVIHRLWASSGARLPRFFAWLVTFLFINMCWVFFRAPSFEAGLNILGGMIGLNGFVLPALAVDMLPEMMRQAIVVGNPFEAVSGDTRVMWLIICLGITWLGKNSLWLRDRFSSNWATLALVFVLAVYTVNRVVDFSGFLYFEF